MTTRFNRERKPRRQSWEVEAERQAKAAVRNAPFTWNELDDRTRLYMLEEFEAEELTNCPYRGACLSEDGSFVYADLMREALRSGDEQSLTAALSNPYFWKSSGHTQRKDGLHFYQLNRQSAALTLARTEYLTWYVRGLARKLIEEGVEECQVYRAAPASDPRGECFEHEGRVVKVDAVYAGHRARYWPEPGNPQAFSIPVGPDCHHAIQRVGA